MKKDLIGINMKIQLEHFETNTKLNFEDYLYNFRVGKNDKDIININFESNVKYLNIFDSVFLGEGVKLYLSPMLFDEDGNEITPHDDRYEKHPDYWYASLFLPLDDVDTHVKVVTTAMKYEYFVSLVDFDSVTDYDCLESVEVNMEGLEWS